jgi:histidine triad (HIT) family protein
MAINNVVSQSVPHLHLHIVPRKRKDGLRGFFWPRQRYPDDDTVEAVAAAIRAALGTINRQ